MSVSLHESGSCRRSAASAKEKQSKVSLKRSKGNTPFEEFSYTLIMTDGPVSDQSKLFSVPGFRSQGSVCGGSDAEAEPSSSQAAWIPPPQEGQAGRKHCHSAE